MTLIPPLVLAWTAVGIGVTTLYFGVTRTHPRGAPLAAMVRIWPYVLFTATAQRWR